MPTGEPSQVLASHLINQIRSSLSVLEQLGVIQAPDADAIRTKLPNPNGPFQSLSSGMDSSFGKMTVASPPPPLPQRMQDSRGKALWDYTGNEADDLRFRAGDVIVIDEEVNDQWYRGRVIPQGEQYPRDHRGLFPSNYVEKISSQMVPYQPPQPPVPYQPYNQYQSQPQPQPQPMVLEDKKHGRFGKVGTTLGHSAVGGLGFGAGSAIGSELIHKIF